MYYERPCGRILSELYPMFREALFDLTPRLQCGDSPCGDVGDGNVDAESRYYFDGVFVRYRDSEPIVLPQDARLNTQG